LRAGSATQPASGLRAGSADRPASGSGAVAATQDRGRRLADAARAAGVEVRTGTSVWDATRSVLHLLSGDRVSTVEFRAVVVATGAHERVFPVPGWTLPGVYTAGGMQALLKEHGVVPGHRVLFAGSGPLPLVVAAELVRRGIEVAGVFEAARVPAEAVRHPWTSAAGLWGQWDRLREGAGAAARLMRARVPVRSGRGLVRVIGRTEVEAAEIARLDHDWRPVPGSEQVLECDTVAVHHGLSPATELLRLLGAEFAESPDLGGRVPVRTGWLETSVPGVFAAGDCAGIGGAGLSLVEGERAGVAAAAHALANHAFINRADARPPRAFARERRFQRLYGALFTPRPGVIVATRADTVVCRCEEVTRAEIDAAVAAGARTTALAKSVTRCGMGPCQGRVCLPTLERLVTEATDTPAVRAPLVPLPFGALLDEAVLDEAVLDEDVRDGAERG
jgi:NADPH-dependent 2,4-dienoyl-CoA reductase/sulfur reductase-like enzyme